MDLMDTNLIQYILVFFQKIWSKFKKFDLEQL
jgi:hypothetical protein